MAKQTLQYRISRLEKLLNINEAKQVGTLYHVCTLQAYLKYIQPSDTLQASGKYKNFVYGGTNYVSFTRDKNFVVTVSALSNSNVLLQLVVDGDKLSEHYKIRPYNDMVFTPSGKRISDGNFVKYREKEEAVKGPIKNISKYIKEINFDIRQVDKATAKDLALISNFNITYKHFIKDNTSVSTLRLQNGDSVKDVMHAINEHLFDEALFDDNDSIVEEAVLAGANTNKYNSNGDTPLTYHCALQDHEDILDILIKDGNADVNLRDRNGNLPICVAVSNNVLHNVQYLIYNTDVNVNAVDGNGRTALDYANEINNDKLIKLLKR